MFLFCIDGDRLFACGVRNAIAGATGFFNEPAGELGLGPKLD